MQSFKPAVLFGALLFTGMLAAQTPDPSQAPAAPAEAPAPRVQSPNPGTGGVKSGQLPSSDPLTSEQQTAKLKADAEHISDMQAAAFARQLNLTPAQIVKLKPILAERQQKLRDAFAQTDPLVDRRTKMEQIRVETQTKIEGILFPVQKTQYERLIAARAGSRPVRPNRPPSRPVIQSPGVTPAAPAVPAAPPATQAAPAPPATPQSK